MAAIVTMAVVMSAHSMSTAQVTANTHCTLKRLYGRLRYIAIAVFAKSSNAVQDKTESNIRHQAAMNNVQVEQTTRDLLTAVCPGVHGLHEGDGRKCESTEGHAGKNDPVPAGCRCSFSDKQLILAAAETRAREGLFTAAR